MRRYVTPPRFALREEQILRAAILVLSAALLLPATVMAGEARTPAERIPNSADASRDDRVVPDAPQDSSEESKRSFRSGPPDTTPYTRPAVPEDYAPQGKPAIPPGITVPAPAESPHEKADDPDGGGSHR